MLTGVSPPTTTTSPKPLPHPGQASPRAPAALTCLHRAQTGVAEAEEERGAGTTEKGLHPPRPPRRAGPSRSGPGRAGQGPAGGGSCGRGGSVQHRGELRGPVPSGAARYRPVRLDFDKVRLGSVQPGKLPVRLGSVRYTVRYTVRYGWVRPGGGGGRGPAEPRLRPLQRRAAPLRSLPRPRGRWDGGGSVPPPPPSPPSSARCRCLPQFPLPSLPAPAGVPAHTPPLPRVHPSRGVCSLPGPPGYRGKEMGSYTETRPPPVHSSGDILPPGFHAAPAKRRALNSEVMRIR